MSHFILYGLGQSLSGSLTPMLENVQKIVHSQLFEKIVLGIILLNAVIIFFEADIPHDTYMAVERVILWIFVLEFVLRFIGRHSTRDWARDPWTYFDASIIIISFIPPELFGDDFAVVLRTLRVLRILRIFRVSEELSLIIMVLVKSVKSLGYAGFVFTIFLYIYAVTGASLFDISRATGPVIWTGNPEELDPYGSPSEAMFTLFRILTGDDWTDLRYNLIIAFPEMSLTITLFHVSWMVLSAFLLLNLVIGAVINNYDRSMEEMAKAREEKHKDDEPLGG